MSVNIWMNSWIKQKLMNERTQINRWTNKLMNEQINMTEQIDEQTKERAWINKVMHE